MSSLPYSRAKVHPFPSCFLPWGGDLDGAHEQISLSSGFWLSLASEQEIGGSVEKEVGIYSSRSLPVGSSWAGCSSQVNVAGSEGQPSPHSSLSLTDGHWPPQPAAAVGCATAVRSPCTSFAQSPAVQVETRWEHEKRQTFLMVQRKSTIQDTRTEKHRAAPSTLP